MTSATRSPPLQADLRRVTYALSDALDLVGIGDLGHGKRVGVMAAECAQAQGMGAAETAFLFDLGMLHDIGVSSTTTHAHLVAEFDWENSQAHCEAGHALLEHFVPLAKFALPIKYHHTRWEQLLAQGVDPQIARPANLIFLVDRVDAMAAPHHADGSLLMNTRRIREQVAAHAGTYFSPELVELFLGASRSEAFWLMLEPRGIQAYLGRMLQQGESYEKCAHGLMQLAVIFSRIVDAKSPFTAEHSLGVSRLARFLAERMGVGPANCHKIEIAGLLHDIGKLRVPDEILDKPARLDERERKVIDTHSFETYQILRPIPGFEEIALWAAYHHEEPGGHGYPFHLPAQDLPLEARILRVADIFQAMAQDRPYRAGLPAGKVREFIENLARRGRVDAGVVAVATADLAGSMAAARPSPTAPEQGAAG
jgi:putative nucleotidyltransferase with HDIG domain